MDGNHADRVPPRALSQPVADTPRAGSAQVSLAPMLSLRSTGWVNAFVIVALVTSGCERAASEVIRAAVVEPIVAPVVKAPTQQQEKVFIDHVLSTARRGDAASFNDLIDWDALSRRAARNLHAPQGILDGVVKGAREACAGRGVCESLAAVGQGKAKLRHLGPLTIDGERWTSFRRMPTEGGFEHISFLVSVDAKGVARAIDVLMLSLGETSSDTLRRALLPMLAIDQEHVVRRLQGTESAFAKHGAEIAKAQQLAAAGKPADALAVLNGLPTTLRNDRFVMAQRITIAGRTGDQQAYLAAIDELAARHPRERVTLLNLLDAYAMRGRFIDAITVVGQIEAIVAPDPYLDVLRSNLLASANLPIDAATAARRAIEREPDLIDAHWALVAATLKQPAYPDTTRALMTLHRLFGVQPSLDGMPEYAGYVASTEYAALKAQLSM